MPFMRLPLTDLCPLTLVIHIYFSEEIVNVVLVTLFCMLLLDEWNAPHNITRAHGSSYACIGNVSHLIFQSMICISHLWLACAKIDA